MTHKDLNLPEELAKLSESELQWTLQEALKIPAVPRDLRELVWEPSVHASVEFVGASGQAVQFDASALAARADAETLRAVLLQLAALPAYQKAVYDAASIARAQSLELGRKTLTGLSIVAALLVLLQTRAGWERETITVDGHESTQDKKYIVKEPTSDVVVERFLKLAESSTDRLIGVVEELAVRSAPPVAEAQAPAAQTPAPAPTHPEETLLVGNTDQQGAYLHHTASITGRIRAYTDGTRLRVIGPDVTSEGTLWKHVRAPDGEEGFILAEYTESPSSSGR